MDACNQEREARNTVEDPDTPGSANFAKVLGRRVTKVAELFQQPLQLRKCTLVAVLAEPIDSLVLQILHRDIQGRVLFDMVSKHCNPVRTAQIKLATSLRNNLDEVFFSHFSVSYADRSALFDDFRAVAMECSAELAYGLDFSTWPYSLLLMVSPDHTEAEHEEAGHRLLRAKECCLDKYLSLPMKKDAAGSLAKLRRPCSLEMLRA